MIEILRARLIREFLAAGIRESAAEIAADVCVPAIWEKLIGYRKALVDRGMSESDGDEMMLRSLTAEPIPPDPVRAAAMRHRNRLSQYGLSDEGFEDILASQENRCAICSRPFGASLKTHIDHCHITGKVRGILCSRCNSGLGMLGDSEPGLLVAIAYLRRSSG